MSWKDLSELTPQLTEGEARFERGKRLIGFFLGPLSFLLILLFAPPLNEVTPVGMRSLAVFSWIIIWWITEAIPIPATAILSLPLIAVCGIWPYQRAFSYWSHWVVMFTIGAFLIGHAMQLHGLTRRFGLALVGSRLVAGNPWRLLVFYLIATAVASAFLSNVATTVLFLSMGIGLLEILKIKPGSQYGMALFLGIAWVANIGGMLTPGGTPTNLIAIGLTDQLMNYRMGYVEWFLGALPFVALQMAVMFGVLRYFLPKKEIEHPISTGSVHEELQRLGPFSRGEKYAAAALIAAVILWAIPDLVPIWLGRTHPVSVLLRERLNWGVAALLVASSLFMMPLDWQKRKFAMTWSEAARNIEWGTAALVASALAVGEMIGDNEVGLGRFFAYSVGAIGGPESSQYLFLLATIVITVVLTNLTTTVAVISFMAPIALTVAPSLGLNPIALTVVISFSSTLGYAFPMANPPCAMVFASGHVRIVPMFLRGSLLAVIGIVLLSFVGYPMADRIFPWPLAAP